MHVWTTVTKLDSWLKAPKMWVPFFSNFSKSIKIVLIHWCLFLPLLLTNIRHFFRNRTVLYIPRVLAFISYLKTIRVVLVKPRLVIFELLGKTLFVLFRIRVLGVPRSYGIIAFKVHINPLHKTLSPHLSSNNSWNHTCTHFNSRLGMITHSTHVFFF